MLIGYYDHAVLSALVIYMADNISVLATIYGYIEDTNVAANVRSVPLDFTHVFNILRLITTSLSP